MPLSHEGPQRSPRNNLLIALTLPGVAGAVNAFGLLELGHLTTHLTGAATEAGIGLARADRTLAFRAMFMLGAFLGGAMMATWFVERARRLGFGHARFAAALLIEAFLLSAVTAVTIVFSPLPSSFTWPLIWSLAFAMGLQNALITKISGAVVRTTHVTGLVTDFGIELVRIFYWLRDRISASHGIGGFLYEIRVATRDPELSWIKLHGIILLSFISGATGGTALVLRFHQYAMLAPVSIVIGLVVFDRWRAQKTTSISSSVS